MAVPLLDLTRQYAELQSELEAAALRVLRSGRYVMGPESSELECELAGYLGARDVIALSSGTDALLAALMALDVGPGDAVALPAYTFFATAGVVARLGARPVFVDVEPRFLNLDPELLARALDQHRDVKAVIAVHLYGAAADLAAIRELVTARGIALIEDAAQAIGTRLGDGSLAGTASAAGCFSTFPSKNLGGLGDGGFLATMDADFGLRIRQLRNHGQTDAYRHQLVGGNFRMDELQAALLRVKVPHIDAMNSARRANAARYHELLAAADLGDRVLVPEDQPHHTYHQYVVHLRGADRDAVRAVLHAKGIGCAVYYPLPLHQQPCFAGLGHRDGDFPVAENASRTNLALPIYPELRADEMEQVVAALAAALG